MKVKIELWEEAVGGAINMDFQIKQVFCSNKNL